jgi:hypothetical protein
VESIKRCIELLRLALIQYNKEINDKYAAAMDGEIERKHKNKYQQNEKKYM